MDNPLAKPVAEGAATILLKGQRVLLLPNKVLYWESRKLMVVSDVHLGKAGHFRKHGIAVPGNIHTFDLQHLSHLLATFDVVQLVFLGDLFHSDANAEWSIFEDWARNVLTTKLILVKGNHDILAQSSYENCGLEVTDRLDIDPFSFTHEEDIDDARYNISGHLHPAVRLRGPAKQGLKLPCFYFRPTHAYMPAFGNFTGLFALRKKQGDKIFAVTGSRVLRVN